MSDVPPPPGGYPQQPGQPPAGGYQPPPAPGYQPPQQPPQPPPSSPPGAGYQPQATPAYQPPPGMAPGVQPPPVAGAQSSNGCLKAFLIVLVISLVLGVASCAVFVLVINKAVDDALKSFGVANAADYDVKIDTCTVDDFGSLKATGTLTNKRNVSQAYQVKVSFSDESNVKLGDGIGGYTGTLTANQSGTWDVTSFENSAAGKTVTCKVSEVDYTLFNTK